MSTVDLTQWKDRTEEPAIVWAYVGTWDLQPVAVDDTHDADTYNELTRAWYAAGAYQTIEEVKEEADAYDLTPAEVEELYTRADCSAHEAGLPFEYYAEGVNEDGSDAIIYVSEVTEAETHRETLAEAARYLDPEDLAEIRAEIEKARAEYDR